MKSAELLRFARWILLVAIAPAAWAQDSGTSAAVAVAAGAAVAGTSTTPAASTATTAGAPGAAAPASAAASAAATSVVPAVAKSGGATGVSERTMTARFSREKPVLGLPLGSSTTRAHCSADGTAFYDLTSSGAMAGQELYSISSAGGVMHLLRKLPIDYTNVLVRDFFAGDQQLVTLLEADQRDDGTEALPPRVRDYFLSLEDQSGDSSNLVRLDIRFKPVKVARFASGDVMVLGWDEGNLLPVLAMVKEDGTIRRFVDLDAVRPSAPRDARGDDSRTEAETAKQERATLESLQGATFVAFGSEVLLTWPETTKPILALGASGEARAIPVAIPGGYVLNDALTSSGGRGTLVLRVKEADVRTQPTADESGKPPKMMLMEYDAVHGSLIGRITFDKPTVADVTCAPNSSLVAMFYDTIPDADRATTNGATGAPTSTATQLVVATARR